MKNKKPEVVSPSGFSIFWLPVFGSAARRLGRSAVDVGGLVHRRGLEACRGLLREREIARRELGRNCGDARVGFHVAGLGGDRVPFIGVAQTLLHARAALIENGKIELGVDKAELGGIPEPARGFGEILFDAPALEVRNRKAVHGTTVALFGGSLVPVIGLERIGRNAMAASIERAEPILGRRLAL